MKKFLIFYLFIFVTACSQFEPFEDRRREAGQIQPIGSSTDNAPAICYNPIWHSEEEILLLADQACKRTNRKAVFQQKKAFSCRFVNPSIAIYKCE